MSWQDDEVVSGPPKPGGKKVVEDWETDEVVVGSGGPKSREDAEKAVLRRKALPKPATKEEAMAGLRDIVHKGKLVATNVMGGLATPAIAGQDRPGPVEGVVEAFTGRSPEPNSVGAGQRAIGNLVTQPKTTAERYMAAGSQGIGGALWPMPGTTALGPVRTLTAGGVGGAAGEAAGQATATDEHPEGSVLARFLASLVGGGAVAAPGSGVALKPPLVQGAESTLSAVGKQGIDEAATRAQRASRTLGGVPVLVPQGLDDATPAQGLMAELSRGRKTAGPLHSIFANQKKAGSEAARRFVSGISEGSPGQTEANAVQEAAIRELSDRPKELAKQHSAKAYQEGLQETFPADVRYSEAIDGNALLNDMRILPKSDAGRALLNRASRMMQKTDILKPDGKTHFMKLSGEPTEIYNFAKELKKLVSAGYKDSAVGADKTRAVGLQRLADAAENLLAEHAPSTTQANSQYAEIMGLFSDPVRESPISTMVPKGSDARGTAASWKNLNVVLENSENYTPKDVKFVAFQLNQSDPKAFPAMVRQHLEAKLEPFAKSGRDVPTAEISVAMFGQPGSRQRANTLAAIEEAARAQGRNPKDARAAAEGLADALIVISHDRGGVGALTESAARTLLGGFSLGLGRSGWLGVRGRPGVENGFNHKAVLDALTSPDAADRLKKVADFSLARNRVKAAALALKTAGASTNDNSEE